MEYRLNKIDMELRDKINENTSQKKIHRKTAIQGMSNRTDNKDKDKGKNNTQSGEKQQFTLLDDEPKNGKITITAVKSKKISIDLDAFRDNRDISDPDRGSFLDVRK